MEIDIVTAVFAVVVLQAIGIISSMRRTKRVWIIEDSESDIVLYKLKLEVPGCHLEYYRDVKSIGWRALFNRPDGMIVDYYLTGTTKGDELFKFCKNNSIPVLMVTGHEGEILGVPKRDTIHKEKDSSHYSMIKDWIESTILTH